MGCETDLAWCAGFLDGEGSFLLATDRNRPMIQAQQIVSEPIERLKDVLGGSTFERTNRTVKGHPIYQWNLQGGVTMRRVIPMLLPYLTVKRQAASLLLEFAHTMPSRGVHVTPEQKSEQERLVKIYRGMPERRSNGS